MSSEEKLSVDQLQINKHLRMKGEHGSIDAHCSGNGTGVWVKSGDSIACVYANKKDGAVIALYPASSKHGLPFAISKNGIQLPTEGEDPIVMTWQQIKEVVAAFKNK